MGNKEKYIVIAEVNTKYKGCQVAPADAIFVATHRQVFGPDTKENCEKWKAQNCG